MQKKRSGACSSSLAPRAHPDAEHNIKERDSIPRPCPVEAHRQLKDIQTAALLP